MNIQIFGKNKCFDTKKAQRYFKERRINFQMVDINSKGLSKGELKSVIDAVGDIEKLIKTDSDAYLESTLRYLSDTDSKIEKLLESPELYRTPIVRNGKQATVGYCPEVWKSWE